MKEKHLPGLDTLRSFAILAVMASHLRPFLGKYFLSAEVKKIFQHGWIGVDLFFVLSGFLIGSQLFRELKNSGTVKLDNFYVKRIFRILPPYFVVLALYYLWPIFREAPEIDSPIKFILFYMNYGRSGEAFSHAFSLCIEEHFYLTFPLAVYLGVKYFQKLNVFAVIGFLLFFEVVIRLYLKFDGAAFYPAIYRKTHTRLDGLILGVTLALLSIYRPILWKKLVSYPKINFAFGTAAILFTINVLPEFGEVWDWPLRFLVLSLGFAAWVVAANSETFWLGRIKVPGAALLATLSYSVYLTHKQMFHFANLMVEDADHHKLLTYLVIFLLVSASALFLHYLIEKPALNLRNRILKSKRISIAQLNPDC